MVSERFARAATHDQVSAVSLVALVILVAASCVSIAHAEETSTAHVYTDPRPLMAEAIRTGHSHGQIGGPIATLFVRQFNSDGPLEVDMTAEQSLPQPASKPPCARLHVVWTQAGALTPNGRDTAVLDTHLNVCADGSPPGDGDSKEAQ